MDIVSKVLFYGFDYPDWVLKISILPKENLGSILQFRIFWRNFKYWQKNKCWFVFNPHFHSHVLQTNENQRYMIDFGRSKKSLEYG